MCGLRVLYLQRVVQMTLSEVFRLRSHARAAEEEPLLGSEDESEWTEEEDEPEEDEEEARWGYSELPAIGGGSGSGAGADSAAREGDAAAAAANPARDVEAGVRRLASVFMSADE